MGYFELANMLGSSLLGAVLTIWKQRIADDQERFKMALQGFQASEESQSPRLAFRSDKGFHLTRRIIALLVITTLVCGPVVFPLLVSDLAIVIGYYDTSRGFWPWSGTVQSVQWIGFGSADASRVITISPVHNNMAMTIIGMFFGNQMTK